MNRVVWTYRDYREVSRYQNKVSHDFELMCPEEVETLKTSLASWAAFAPEYKRVIYLDEGVRNYLLDLNLLQYYDEVHLVDFQKEIDEPYKHINFFAAPKLWVIGQQSEPFILVDTEMMLRTDLKDWFQEDSYYAIRYPASEYIHFSNWPKESREKFFMLRTMIPVQYRRFLNPQNMINAGFISWPNPQICQRVSEDALNICDKVCSTGLSFPEKWTLCEESILPSLIEYYGGKTINSIEFTAVDESCNLVEYSSLSIFPEFYEGFKFDVADVKRRKPEFAASYQKMFGQ